MSAATDQPRTAYPEGNTDRERDLAILSKVQQGDPESFGMLVRHYELPIFNFMTRHRMDQETAADLTQEAFLKAFRSLGSFRAERSSFKTWLYTIAFNLLRDHARRHKVRVRRSEAMAQEQKVTPPQGDIGAEIADRDQIDRLLHQVDPETRSLLVLRFLQDIPYGEISEVTGLNPATIRSKVHRGLKKIQAHLQENENEVLS